MSPIGAITVARAKPGPFPEKQIALLKTFANQAVIAIENVRLFNETKEALERQTATAEILKVISSSPTDTQPVFDAIVQSAVRLCDAVYSAALRLEGGLIHLVAHHNWSGDGLATARRLFPMSPDQDHVSAGVIRESRLVHLQHLQTDPAVPASSRELAIAQGHPHASGRADAARAVDAIGAIVVAKAEGPFSRHGDDAARDLCRPGGDSDRERAPVQGARRPQSRAEGGVGAADGDERRSCA